MSFEGFLIWMIIKIFELLHGLHSAECNRNFENDISFYINQVRINPRFHENVCMRQSTMTNDAISNIKKDLLGQPLQLLSGVDILGNASSALGHMSKGVAALSMDKKFIQSRQKQVCL